MFEIYKTQKAKLVKLLMTLIVMIVAFGQSALGAIDFSAITDLLNVTFDVLDIVVANTSTLINVVVLFATLGLVGIIIYGFIGKLLTKVAGEGLGGMGRRKM